MKILSSKKGEGYIVPCVLILVIVILFMMIFNYAVAISKVNVVRENTKVVLDSFVTQNSTEIYNSIKQGKKIIIPKVCLVEFLLDQKNYQILSPVVPNNHWTCDGCCGSVVVAQESKVKNNKKGA